MSGYCAIDSYIAEETKQGDWRRPTASYLQCVSPLMWPQRGRLRRE
jgi:hypothetical protein